MKAACLGPKGTFSEEAALRYYHGMDIEVELYETIPDVIEAIGERKVDQAIVPLENTIEGTIKWTIDSLLQYDQLSIISEYILPVSLHLMTNQIINPSDVREVWSISPILTQCRNYIRSHQMKNVPYDSSASAAHALKISGRMDIAAIGSNGLAKLLGLNVIDSNIQDNMDNETRFIVLRNHMNTESRLQHTMFVVTPDQDQPGVLSNILNIFSALSINLSWIESRPTTRKLGRYRFFLESTHYCNKEQVDKAIIILQTLGCEVRILGRYNTISTSHY